MTAYLSRFDVVALLRATERAAHDPQAEEALAQMMASLGHGEAIQAVAVLLVAVEAAHRSGASGETWAGFLADLDR